MTSMNQTSQTINSGSSDGAKTKLDFVAIKAEPKGVGYHGCVKLIILFVKLRLRKQKKFILINGAE